MPPSSRFVIAVCLIAVIAIGLLNVPAPARRTTNGIAHVPAIDQHTVAVAYCARNHGVLMPSYIQIIDFYPPEARARILAYRPEYGPGYARTICAFDRMLKDREPWPALDPHELVLRDGLCEPWLRELRVSLRKTSPTPDIPACGDPAREEPAGGV